MIKLIRFVLFLFYKYYSVGPKAEIAFFSAVTSFLCILFLNVTTILGLLGVGLHQIMPFKLTDATWKRYLNIAIFISIPSYLIMYMFFKKKEIVNLKFDHAVIDLGNILLVVYVIASIVASVIWALP